MGCASHLIPLGMTGLMTPVDDDDDWVGTPPEGRYSRDRARPEFWRTQRPLLVAGTGLMLALIVLVVVLVAS